MPPKAKVTKDMIVDAAFEIARESGAEAISARTVAQRLRCSTQPVMYHFAKMEDLKRAAYAKADGFHTDYLLSRDGPQEDVLLGIGLRYLRFAVEEPLLFRFLFQSGFAAEGSLPDMLNADGLRPVLGAMQAAMGLSMEDTREVFLTLAMVVHGYASLLVNRLLTYDEELAAAHLEKTYRGAVLAVREAANEGQGKRGV